MNARQAIILLLAALLAPATVANAEDPVNIPDPALKAAIEGQLGIPAPTPTDMLALTSLDARGKGIADLTGLEYAANLEILCLSGNQIADISVVAGLTNLKELWLEGNRITDIRAVAGLVNLTRLRLHDNQVADIAPLAGLTDLIDLRLGNNRITDVSVVWDLTNLTHLDLRDCEISDISRVAGLTDLTHLVLNDNQISDISAVAGLTDLQELWLQDNQVTDIGAVAGLINLTMLLLDGNQIVDASAVAGLANMVHLTLGNNRITDVSAVWDLTNLTYLDLCDCAISDISRVAGLTDLTYLLLNDNDIIDISAISGLTDLKELWLRGNQITDIDAVAGLTSLTTLLLDRNQIADISPLSGLTNLGNLTLGHNRITDVSVVWDLTNLTKLDLSDCAISDLSRIVGLTRLMHLFLNYNQITDASVLAGLTDLKLLWLKDNQIGDISPLANLPNLSQLDLAWNGLTDVSALTPMTSLAELWLDGNPLHPKACIVDIPLIRANNPGVVIHYGGCVELPQTLTISSTVGGSVVMPGEGAFTYSWGDLVPVEAVADEGYQFTHWVGTAVDPNVMLDPCAPHTSVLMDSDHSLTAHFKPQDKPWHAVYFNDFEGEVGPEWSQNLVDATPIGERRFLGQFGSDTVTLALANLPPHSHVRATFDLFIIRSWDGDGLPAPPGVAAGRGPDLWWLDVDEGSTLLRTTFDNHNTEPYVGFHRQSYPFEYPHGESPPQTGCAEVSTLGYVWDFPDTEVTPCDSVYHLHCEFAHDAQSLRLAFSAVLTEALDDESWGLGNVRVEVLAPVPEATLTISSTAGGAVTEPGEGDFSYELGAAVAVQAAAEVGYHFTHWSGTAVDAGKVTNPMSASTTVVVDGDCTLIANFAADQRTLTVSSTTGGSVTVPGEGTFEYPVGSPVAVLAVADGHSHFTHWSGTAVEAGRVADPNSASTSVTIDADYTLVANFRTDQCQLIVSAGTGGFTHVEARVGDVLLAWDGDFATTLDYGTEVTVTATPYAGWKFISWSGTIGTTESPFTFQLMQDCYLEAIWEPEP